jgi:ATP/maltotriose-dependent transcriptional regulator MalT
MYQALNIPWGISNACGAQADAALSLGWKHIVCTKTIEGLKNNLKYHLWNHALYKLHTAAELWLTLGEDELAFMVLGAADHERKRLGRERDRWGLFLLDKLDEPLSDRQARAVERGQSISFKEAIKQTIAALERTAEQQTHAISPAGSSLIDPLTERELEILGLLAQGKSNREIAQQLVLALGTVKTHIHNLCGKLHASSRLQAVARARELRLVD